MGSLSSVISCESLASLVEHNSSINECATLDEVEDYFKHTAYEYAAVVDGSGVVVGLACRHHITELLSGRYGFSLHRRARIGDHMNAECERVVLGSPLQDVLRLTLSRTGNAFEEDVVVIEERGKLVGLVSTERLVHAQAKLLQQQMDAVDAQHRALEKANNELATSLQHQRALERRVIAREKAALIETLVGGIAHELNNKLMPIAGFAEMLRADENFDDDRRMIRDSAHDAARIVQQLLQLSRPTQAHRVTTDLCEPVRKSLQLLQLRLKEADITVDLALPTTMVPVSIDALQIQQVLLNLLMNAVDAMEQTSDRRLRIAVSCVHDQVRLEVRDTGAGIDPNHLNKIFDPFFTTKSPNRGTGLGLSVSYSIIQMHEGDVAVDSTVGVGTMFTILLPLACVDTATNSAQEPAVPPLSRLRARVLVVEDDDAVAALLLRVLRAHVTVDVTRARDGREAQNCLLQQHFDLVVSDVRMPHMTGVDLFHWIGAHRPELSDRVVFTTGDASGSALNADLQRVGAVVLRKPVASSDLVRHAHTILNKRRCA